jgi:hypothetical protein
MKQGNNRRSRSRGGGKRHGGGKGHSFESGGSEMKMRGTAQQLHEKYLALARDASSAGDRIAAESFYQHADHYHRILNADGGNGAGRPQHHQQHPQHQQHQQHRGGPDQRHDQRPAPLPPGSGPQPVVPAAAMAVQAGPDGKPVEAAKTPTPQGRGPGPVAT